MTHRPSTDTAHDGAPAAPGRAAPNGDGEDPLAELIGLVTARALLLDVPNVGEGSMATLKEAVDALGRYLDILEFIRTARGQSAVRVAEPAAAEETVAEPGVTEATFVEAADPDGTVAEAAAAESAEAMGPPLIGPPPGPIPDARGIEVVPNDAGPTAAPSDGGSPSAPHGPAGDVRDADYPPFRDQLTGLHSREGFDAIAAGELKRCRRHGRVFSMVLFELTGLDDAGLSRAASAILASIRESDLAGRRDARVLSVALPETSPTEARVVAERILRQFEGTGAWGTWARLALVTHPTHGETLRHLLDASEAQLTLPTRRVLASAENGNWPH